VQTMSWLSIYNIGDTDPATSDMQVFRASACLWAGRALKLWLYLCCGELTGRPIGLLCRGMGRHDLGRHTNIQSISVCVHLWKHQKLGPSCGWMLQYMRSCPWAIKGLKNRSMSIAKYLSMAARISAGMHHQISCLLGLGVKMAGQKAAGRVVGQPFSSALY
jgi:hypothetical protein